MKSMNVGREPKRFWPRKQLRKQWRKPNVSMLKLYLELAHSLTVDKQQSNLKFPLSPFFLKQKTKKQRRWKSQRHPNDISEVVQPINAIEEELNQGIKEDLKTAKHQGSHRRVDGCIGQTSFAYKEKEVRRSWNMEAKWLSNSSY